MSPSSVKIETERRPFFTIESLAVYLAVSERTVRYLLSDGEIPSYKIGAARRIDADDVDEYLAARRQQRA